MPTKAATAVPTPSMGRDPASTSSTYTPGDRYCGMRLPPPWGLCPACCQEGSSATSPGPVIGVAHGARSGTGSLFGGLVLGLVVVLDGAGDRHADDRLTAPTTHLVVVHKRVG